ncbi:MAG TPA: hypothetical protein VEX67_13980 [Solirubrobacteraceae bacterium]|nr:hypothetical protein [Solirubrobacteraceae bacterium]
MTARLLALDLRRGPAPLLALAMLGLGGALVLGAPGGCDGRWPDAVLALRDAGWIVFPCVLAAGVWRGGSARRRQLDDAITASPLPAWRRSAIEGGAIAIAGVATFVVLLAALTVTGGCTSGLLAGRPAAAALAGVLALLAAAFTGLALGRFAVTPMAAPLALLATLAVTFVAGGWSGGSADAMLLFPAVGEDVTPRQLTVRISAGQILWFAGLAVSGWLLASRFPARFRLTRLVPAAAGLAALAALNPGAAG